MGHIAERKRLREQREAVSAREEYFQVRQENTVKYAAELDVLWWLRQDRREYPTRPGISVEECATYERVLVELKLLKKSFKWGLADGMVRRVLPGEHTTITLENLYKDGKAESTLEQLRQKIATATPPPIGGQVAEAIGSFIVVMLYIGFALAGGVVVWFAFLINWAWGVVAFLVVGTIIGSFSDTGNQK